MLTLDRKTELLQLTDELNDTNAFRAVADILTEVDRADLLSEPHLGNHLVHAWFRLDNLSDALTLVAALAEPCRKRGFDRVFRRNRNLEGAVLLEMGHVDQAEAAFLEVLNRSIAADDQMYVAHATLNLGVVAGYRGDWARSIMSTERAAAAFHRLGLVYALGACYQNLGIAYREFGRLDLSDSHFEQSYAHFYQSGVDIALDLASAEFERALSMNAAGDTERAEATASRALARILAVRSPQFPVVRHEGDAQRVLGILFTVQHRTAEARSCLHRALECAREAGTRMLLAEVIEAMARLADEEGQWDESQALRREAVEIYTRLGASGLARRLKAELTVAS